MIAAIRGKTPTLADDVYLAPGAVVIGDVVLAAGVSVWFNAVIRGDVEQIRIGSGSNVQDNATIHVTRDTWPTHIGAGVTVGHAAVIHGCVIGDHSLIGIGAVLLDGVEVGAECLVGAGALLVPGMKIPARSCVLGRPARVARAVRPEEIHHLHRSAENYVAYAREYRAAGISR